MKDITKVFIDLSKLSEEQRKHIFSLLPEPLESDDHYIVEDYIFLTTRYSDDNYWIVVSEYDAALWDKTELTYAEFIKLFEGEKEIQVSFSMDEMIAFGKKCFYKGFDKCETDDANCYTAWREEAGLLIEQIKH